MSSQGTNESSTNLRVIKTEMKATGEAVQLVRPLATTSKSAEEIIGELVNQFDYKSKQVKASDNELNAVQQAFGSNLAQELIKTYDGSNLTADSQQDLVGDRYLAKQIEIIQHQQKTSSILDKWSHLLYEGEKDDAPGSSSGAASSASAAMAAQNRQNIEATSLRVINKSSSYNSLLAKQQQRQIEEQIQHAQLMQQSQQHMHHHHHQATPPPPPAQLQHSESLRHSRSGNNYASVQTLISNQFQNKHDSHHQSVSEIQSLMETQQISIGSGTVEESRRQSAQTSIGSTALEDDNHHSRRQSMHTSLGSGTIQESRRSSAMEDSSRRQSAHTGISSGVEESRLHSAHTSAIEESSRRQSGHMSNLSSALDETESSRRQSTNTQSVLDSSHGQYTSVGSSVLEDTQSRRQSAHTSIALSALEQSRLHSIHTSIGSSVMEDSSRRQSTQASRASSMREHARAQALLESQAHSQAESEQAEYRAEYERHYDQTQANLARSRSHTAQQPQPFLPPLSSSNLNAVQLDAYDSPQFKAMLEQLLKPLNLPPEQINYPADWPSQDKIHLLAEPIYIPAPQPIVIPAPNILTIQNHPLEKSYTQDLPPDAIKPTVTYYPSIATDQAHMKNFGIRQINTN